MTNESITPAESTLPTGPSLKSGPGWKILAIVLGVLFLLLLGGIAWYWYYFHAGKFRPTQLSEPEREVLEDKIEYVSGARVEIPDEVGEGRLITGEPLELEGPDDQSQVPERFRDMPEKERLGLEITEREINGFISHNSDLGETLYIDLKPDAIVAKVVWPVDEDVPFLGGKTVRVRLRLGVEMEADGHLRIEMEDVTVSGFPIPDSWLGDIKGVELSELDEDLGQFLDRIGQGLETFEIANDRFRLRLKQR